MLCSQKYDLNWGLQQLREVWTKNFKTSPSEEDDVEMTGDGEDLGESSPDEDDFEKHLTISRGVRRTSHGGSGTGHGHVTQVEGDQPVEGEDDFTTV